MTSLKKTPRRGSAIAVTLIFALVLATVGASFMSLTTSGKRTNEANYTHHALQSVLERGVDQAMYALGKYRDTGFDSACWTKLGWTTKAKGYSKDLGDCDLGNNRTARLNVTIQNLPSDAKGSDASGNLIAPFILAEAAFPGSSVMGTAPYTRQVLVLLKPSASGSRSGGLGMVMRGTIT